MKAVEFYGDRDNWEPNNYQKKTSSWFCAFLNEDEERIDSHSFGGKLARETKKKIEVINDRTNV